MNKKGEAPTWTVITLAVLVLMLIGGIGYVMVSGRAASLLGGQTVTVTTPIDYTGEFKTVGLVKASLEYPFFTAFTILPVVFSTTAQTTAGYANYTLVNGTTYTGGEFQLDLYFEINDDAENLNLEYTVDTLETITDEAVTMKSVQLYDYDTAKVIKTIAVDKNGEFDYDTGVLKDGEYVLRIIYTSAGFTWAPVDAATSYDLIGTLEGKLTTDGDVDEFTSFLISFKQ
jgi:hypothetical protein